jgi:Fe-S-cluster containining protein
MILTPEDIQRIESLGYNREEFSEFRDGYYRLRNVSGRCYFLEPEKGRCKIYSHRPAGCIAYPVIYDPEKGFILDPECPAINTISDSEFMEKVDLLEKTLRKIGIRPY